MKTLTINLTDDMEQRLRELSERGKTSPEQTLYEIVRRRLLVDRFHELCRESESYAREAGFASEDELLRSIS